MDEGERKALEDIEKYGCHVIHVMAEDELPPFAYTVGIQRASNAPELIVIGLKQPMAHFILNEYNRRIREGEHFSDGQFASDFLEGFNCQFRTVERTNYREYFSWDLWLYKGDTFEALQFVYPNTNGIWPWELAADDWFKSWQPLLTNSPLS